MFEKKLGIVLVSLSLLVGFGIIQYLSNEAAHAREQDMMWSHLRTNELTINTFEPTSTVQIWRVAELPPGIYRVVARQTPPSVAWVEARPKGRGVYLMEDAPIGADVFSVP